MGVWLPNIELTEEEYQNMLEDFFDYGSESVIVREGRYAIKIFREDFGHEWYTKEQIEEVRENKLRKIVKLTRIKNFDNELIPLATYSYRKKFIAYKMCYLKYPNLGDVYLDEKTSLFYLKLVKEKLLKIHELGIIYGDIKDDNIFVNLNQKRIIFGDLDNMKIQDNPIDLMAPYTEKFIKKYGRVDEKVDSYTMNLMTLYYLHYYGRTYDEILKNLEGDEFFIPDKALATPKNIRLLREMKHIDHNYRGKYFIDNL